VIFRSTISSCWVLASLADSLSLTGQGPQPQVIWIKGEAPASSQSRSTPGPWLSWDLLTASSGSCSNKQFFVNPGSFLFLPCWLDLLKPSASVWTTF
jgi:hypothetical protein